MAQSDEVGLSQAPKDVVCYNLQTQPETNLGVLADCSARPNPIAKDSCPLLGSVNGQPPGMRNPKLTKFDKGKWKIEEIDAVDSKQQRQIRKLYITPSNICWLCVTLRDRWFAVLLSLKKTNKK